MIDTIEALVHRRLKPNTSFESASEPGGACSSQPSMGTLLGTLRPRGVGAQVPILVCTRGIVLQALDPLECIRYADVEGVEYPKEKGLDPSPLTVRLNDGSHRVLLFNHVEGRCDVWTMGMFLNAAGRAFREG